MADMATGARAAGVALEFLDYREFCSRSFTAQELDVAFRRNAPDLAILYSRVAERARQSDVFLVVDRNVYHPDFLDKLQAFKVFYSIDDPDSSFENSMPYAYAFDSVFTVTPRYNAERTMVEQYRRWGCERPHFVPLGAISTEYSDLDEAAVFRSRREVGCVFVGTATTAERIERLINLKKTFRHEFQVYGDWRWRTIVTVALRHGYPMPVRPCASKIGLYRRSRIGINIHDSGEYGFGNRRVFELPINGVMQLCDFKRTDLGACFEIGKEVVGYESTAEARDLIRYYLSHDDERQEIAVNGFRRARRQYLFCDLFAHACRTIASECVAGNGSGARP